MIGQLRGILIEKQPPGIMVEVHGVGYLLQAPLSTFLALPELGHEVVLRTHFIVREEAQLLYGFITHEECQLFQDLIKINGVGPKIALALLSGMSPTVFSEVLQAQAVDRLTKVPGIGAKTAQRIVVEMQGRRISNFDHVLMQGGAKQEAMMALVALGYKAPEATRALGQVEPGWSCEQMIKEALQKLVKR